MTKGLFVSLAHEVAEQFIVQVALHIEEGCQHQTFPHPAHHSIAWHSIMCIDAVGQLNTCVNIAGECSPEGAARATA